MKKFFAKVYAYIKELGHLTPIGFVTVFLPMIGSAFLILVAYPLGHWLRGNWEIGLPIFLFGIVFFCGLALVPTNIIGIIAGWTFSFYLGIAVLVTGVVGAASISFLIHSWIVGDKLSSVFESHPKAEAVFQALVGQSVWRTTLIISLLRLSPALPFALTNFLMASARVPPKAFVLGTFFGMLPRSGAVVYVGSGLSKLTVDNPQNTSMIVFGLVATVISVIVISLISKNALNRLMNENVRVESV